MKVKPDNNDNSLNLFYAKILLFGEYSVIFDSMALSIPFGHFTAGFSFLNRNKYTDHNSALQSNAVLKEYSLWLNDISTVGRLKNTLDIKAFERDIDEGMFLESNIPQSYGLGSSGALCAAVYDRYAHNRISNDPTSGYNEMRELKNIFAIMESWFHGTSSGMDPLNSYFGRPLLVEPGEKISITGIPVHDTEERAAIFLIDSGHPGKTEPLVRLFLEKSRNKYYMDMIDRTFIPAVNKSIISMIGSDIPGFMSNLKVISGFQLKYMKEMIPDYLIPAWEHGLNSDDYFLKLCGSGGGGYLLGFTGDMENTSEILGKTGIKTMPVYMNL